jgi:hypothetical protein
MDIEVNVISPYVSVELGTRQTIEITPNVSNPIRFGDLLDVNDTNKNDQYVIMYNATTNNYELVNPDKVLSSASNNEPIQPGLPSDFENVLDVDLDNRIDLDAGSF